MIYFSRNLIHTTHNIHIRMFQDSIDYIMVRNKDRKRVRDVKVIPGEKVVQQKQQLVFDIMIGLLKKLVKPFVAKKS